MSDRPRLLDLFCGAGGAARGYQRAGFYVVGVDIAPQPRYAGDEFVQADALSFSLSGFDAIHASPPCQAHSEATRTAPPVRQGSLFSAFRRDHPELIVPCRARLITTGVPYVIENVPKAPLINPVVLCGSSFDLWVRRHRLFECTFAVAPLSCQHWKQSERRFPANRSGRTQLARVVTVAGHGGTSLPSKGGKASVAVWREAMGIDWMNRDELAQAIPPAYTEYIGQHLLASVSERAA